MAFHEALKRLIDAFGRCVNLLPVLACALVTIFCMTGGSGVVWSSLFCCKYDCRIAFLSIIVYNNYECCGRAVVWATRALCMQMQYCGKVQETERNTLFLFIVH